VTCFIQVFHLISRPILKIKDKYELRLIICSQRSIVFRHYITSKHHRTRRTSKSVKLCSSSSNAPKLVATKFGLRILRTVPRVHRCVQKITLTNFALFFVVCFILRLKLSLIKAFATIYFLLICFFSVLFFFYFYPSIGTGAPLSW